MAVVAVVVDAAVAVVDVDVVAAVGVGFAGAVLLLATVLPFGCCSLM